MANAPAQPVLSVSELTGELKELLETAFDSVWVSGEISNLTRPSSGHCYLTLKDESAQLRAVLWRTAGGRVSADLRDGMEVICQGRIDLYPPRGQYQLVIQQIMPKGLGGLEAALRRLRDKLAAEGLFEARHKKPLPVFPRRIAFVTSPTGAAVRDFLEVLRRRWSGAEVLIVPARVQGVGAAAEIAAGIEDVNRMGDAVDVLVVGRGGGSMEDLWSFNEEIVVRAIFKSRVPVVSAVGHEIDVTLADLVADVRALTPSEAAERVVPARDEILAALDRYRGRLATALRGRATSARMRLDAISTRSALRRPMDRIHAHAQMVDELQARGKRAMGRIADRAKAALAAMEGKLHALSPMAVLERGYTITQRSDNGQLVRSAEDVATGDVIVTQTSRGAFGSRVV